VTAPRVAATGFAAGALSVLVFHQGTVALLHLAGLLPNPPFPMRPVGPLGVPQLASLAFWGGIWGIAIAAVLAARPAWPPLRVGLVVGAIGCVLVGFTLVAALRGQPLMAGFDPNRWWRSVVINGAFGWGVGLLLLAARRAVPALR
jgi:sulfite exporter TauE/SafE